MYSRIVKEQVGGEGAVKSEESPAPAREPVLTK